MAEPRKAKKYTTLFPPASQWHTSASASMIEPKKYFDQYFTRENVPEQLIQEVPEKYYPSMLTVIVDIQVIEGKENLFIEETIKNCRASIFEPGIYRFDLLRNREDSSNFALVEVYNSVEAPLGT